MSSSNSAIFFCNCTTFESVGGRYATPHRDATYCITSFFNGAASLEDPIFVRIVSKSIVHLSQESTQDLAFADTSFGDGVCADCDCCRSLASQGDSFAIFAIWSCATCCSLSEFTFAFKSIPAFQATCFA